MIVAVLADTHLRRDPWHALPAAALAEIERADLLLHAGDVVAPAVLEELGRVVQTVAVCGNNDRDLVGVLPETRSLELAGVRVALVHDSGARTGRATRLRLRFPDAGLVVFGHSHLPLDEIGECGQRLFNPGSPTQRRRSPFRAMGRLHLEDGVILAHTIIPLG